MRKLISIILLLLPLPSYIHYIIVRFTLSLNCRIMCLFTTAFTSFDFFLEKLFQKFLKMLGRIDVTNASPYLAMLNTLSRLKNSVHMY